MTDKTRSPKAGLPEKPLAGAIDRLRTSARSAKKDILAVTAAVIAAIAATGCGEAFSSGNPATDPGVTGGSGGHEGGAGGKGGSGGVPEGGSGASAGSGAAGGGGTAGSGGCEGIPLTFSGMENFEVDIKMGLCNGPVAFTTLENDGFETGQMTACLTQGNIYKLVAQVMDPLNDNSFRMDLPSDAMIGDARMTTFTLETPIDAGMAEGACSATSGTVPCTDLESGDESYVCSGNPGTLPPSSGFMMTLDTNL